MTHGPETTNARATDPGSGASAASSRERSAPPPPVPRDAPLAQSLRPRGPVQFGLAHTRHAESTVITVTGELDLLTAARFGAYVNEFVHRGRDDIVVDLIDTQFMDSAGLQILLSAQRRAARSGRALSVICPDGPVRRIIEMARLSETLGVLSSLTEYESGGPRPGPGAG